jgi:hypothetical protein
MLDFDLVSLFLGKLQRDKSNLENIVYCFINVLSRRMRRNEREPRSSRGQPSTKQKGGSFTEGQVVKLPGGSEEFFIFVLVNLTPREIV